MKNQPLHNSPASPQDETPPQPSAGARARFIEIYVRGQLDSSWSDWLEGLQMKLLDDGEMVLSGTIIDQAALMGVLNKLGRLNLTLISVNEAANHKKEAV
jgi:hypothetical protein